MKGDHVIVVLAMLIMVNQFIVHPSEAIITCLDVDRLLEPCLPCLRSGGTPSDDCCKGLTSLQAQSLSKFDRQTVCNCAKSAAITLQIREDYARGLPLKCGITISIPISPTVDCSTISLYDETY